MVPRIFHLRVIDSGRFLRALPSDVRLSHENASLPKKNASPLASSNNSGNNGTTTGNTANKAMGRIDQAPAPSEFLWTIVSLEDEAKSGHSSETEDIPW